MEEITVYHIHFSAKDLGPNLQEKLIGMVLNIGSDVEVIIERIIETNYKGEEIGVKFDIVSPERDTHEEKIPGFHASFGNSDKLH
jgi:hypothetical protein